MPRYPPADQVELGYYELSTHLLALEVLRRGGVPQWIHRSLFTTVLDDRYLGFWCTRTNATAALAASIVGRKNLTRALLADAGLIVPRGGDFAPTAREQARKLAKELGDSVVVKPSNGTKGRGVSVGVDAGAGFDRAWDEACRIGAERLVVEEVVPGIDVRLLAIGTGWVAAIRRIPANVTGDGRSPIRELIASKNAARARLPHLRTHPIAIDDHRTALLAAQGLDLESVLPLDHQLLLDGKANTSAGGEAVDVTDELDPSYLEIAQRAVGSIPSLAIAGVDLIIAEPNLPATANNHAILELNSMPRLVSHHFPASGQPRDAARAVVDLVLEATVPGTARVPAQRARRGQVTKNDPVRPPPTVDPLPDGAAQPSASALIAERLSHLGYGSKLLASTVLTVETGDRLLGFWGSRSPLVSSVGGKILSRRDMSRRFLNDAGIPIPRGAVCPVDDLARARRIADSLRTPLLMEPVRGGRSRAARVKSSTSPEFERVLNAARARGEKHLIAEEDRLGRSVEVLVVGDACPAALRWDPVSEEQEPDASGSSGSRRRSRSVEISDAMHPSYLEVAVRARRAIPGVGAVVVVFVITDPATEAQAGNHVVIDLRAVPRLGPFHYPDRGSGRDAAGALVVGVLEGPVPATPPPTVNPGRPARGRRVVGFALRRAHARQATKRVFSSVRRVVRRPRVEGD